MRPVMNRVVYGRTDRVEFVNGLPVLVVKNNDVFPMKAIYDFRKNGYDAFMPKSRGDFKFKYMVMTPSDFVSLFDYGSFTRFRDYIDVAEQISEHIRKKFDVEALIDAVTTPTKPTSNRVIVKSLYMALLAKEVLGAKLDVQTRIHTSEAILVSDVLMDKLLQRRKLLIKTDSTVVWLMKYSPVRVPVYDVNFLDTNVFSGEIVTDGDNFVDLFSERFVNGFGDYFFANANEVGSFVTESELSRDIYIFLFNDRRSGWKKRYRGRRLEAVYTISNMIRDMGGEPPKVYELGKATTTQPPQLFASALGSS